MKPTSANVSTFPTLNVVLPIPGGQQAEQRSDPHVESTDLYSLRGSHEALRVRIHPVNIAGCLVGPGSKAAPYIYEPGLRAQLSLMACSQRIDGVKSRS